MCVQLVERPGWLLRTANVSIASVFASAVFVSEVFAHLRDGDFALNLLADTLIVYRICERCDEHVVTCAPTQVGDQRFAAFKMMCLCHRQRSAAFMLRTRSLF